MKGRSKPNEFCLSELSNAFLVEQDIAALGTTTFNFIAVCGQYNQWGRGAGITI
jgi:hypothetical protein